jgi:hypothetical protein
MAASQCGTESKASAEAALHGGTWLMTEEDWSEKYSVALSETNRSLWPTRIDEARKAIQERSRELPRTSNERQRLDYAMNLLSLLRDLDEKNDMTNTPSASDWQTLYLAAMMETDNTKLFPKLNEAEAAIFNRLQALSTAKNCQEERTALDDAIRSLRVLKRDQLGFPDWT